MIAFILCFGLMNMIGGRWKDLAPDSKYGRLVFRCILSGLLCGLTVLEKSGSVWFAIWGWFAVTAGSALWFLWGWSFDEITGEHDTLKYPGWIQKIGILFFPEDSLSKTNINRGVLMKGIRGGFDILTFAALLPFNFTAMLWWIPTLTMGLVYRSAVYIVPAKYAVMAAEAMYGCLRGFLIYKAMGAAVWLTLM